MSSCADQYKAAEDGLKCCQSVLENISETVIDFADSLGEETKKVWIDRVLELANANVQHFQTITCTKRELEGMEPQLQGSNDETTKVAVKRIRDQISETSKMDTENTEYVSKIKRLLKISGDEDEDVVMMDTGTKESDFICPYMKTVMVVPMKNKDCSHNISRNAFESLLSRKASFKCVVAGCKALWTKASSSVDEDLIKKMERFRRVQESGGVASMSQYPVTELEDNDDEYTQI